MRVEALGKGHDGAGTTRGLQDDLLGGGELGAPGRGPVGRAVNAVVHGDGTLDLLGEQVGARDVDLAAIDGGVLGTAAGAGQEPDRVPLIRQLEGDGGADGAGTGDDVELGRGGRHGMTFRRRTKPRALLSFSSLRRWPRLVKSTAL